MIGTIANATPRESVCMFSRHFEQLKTVDADRFYPCFPCRSFLRTLKRDRLECQHRQIAPDNPLEAGVTSTRRGAVPRPALCRWPTVLELYLPINRQKVL